MRQIYLFILMLVATQVMGNVAELNAQQFTEIMGVSLNQLTTSFKPNRQYFILFYAPEIQSSLDVRQPFHKVAEQFERRSIQQLKKRGITEFEEFQSNMKKNIVLVEIDCGQNSNICSEFKVEAYPTLLYINRQASIFEYKGWTSVQEMFNFLMRSQQQRTDSRLLLVHQISVNILQKISKYLTNNMILYGIVFVVLPFLYGYLMMSKQKNNSKEKQPKQLNKDKKSEGKKFEPQKQKKNQ